MLVELQCPSIIFIQNYSSKNGSYQQWHSSMDNVSILSRVWSFPHLAFLRRQCKYWVLSICNTTVIQLPSNCLCADDSFVKYFCRLIDSTLFRLPLISWYHLKLSFKELIKLEQYHSLFAQATFMLLWSQKKLKR